MNEKIEQIVVSQNAKYPHDLELNHPHVLEKIAALWELPSQLDQYFETLMITEPGRERQGFAPSVAIDIFRLQRLHALAHPPKTTTRKDPWELIQVNKQPEALSLKEQLGLRGLTRNFLKCAECAECSANRDCLAIEAYLRQGVPVDTTDEGGLTALMIASYKGNERAVEQLLSYGADIHARADGGYGALHWAALGGNGMVIRMLINHRADVNMVTRYGLSPLLQAATNGHYEACQLLIKHGAFVNLASSEGWTPLHKACANGHKTVVELLLENGADRNAENPEKKVPTPLALAIRNKHDAIVELLSGSRLE